MSKLAHKHLWSKHVQVLNQKEVYVMEKKVSQKLAYLNVVGTLLIFLHHANLNITNNSVIMHVMNYVSFLAVPAMSFFFFCTAYLFFRKFSMDKFKSKLLSRSKTLLLPYIVWNTLYELAFMLITFVKNHSCKYDSLLSYIRNVYIFYNGKGCADGPLWYVFRIMTFLLLTPLIFYLVRKKILGAVSIITIIMINMFDLNYFGFWYFLPLYMLGAYTALNYNDKFESYLSGKYRVNCPIVMLIYLLISLIMYSFHVLLSNGTYTYFIRLLSIFIVFYLASIANINKYPIRILKDSTFFVYCSHSIIYKLLSMILLQFDFPKWVSYLLIICVATCMVFTGYIFINKFFPQICMVLTGNRSNKEYKV